MIYMVRHGQTQWNKKGIVQGHKDSKLTTLGRLQSKALGIKLEEILENSPCRVYTSDLGRAVQTTDIITPHLEGVELISKTKLLRERCYGSAEGQDFKTVVSGKNYTDGESYRDVYERMLEFSEKLSDIMDIIVVGHQSSLRILTCIFKCEDHNNPLTGNRIEHGQIGCIDPGYEKIDIITI